MGSGLELASSFKSTHPFRVSHSPEIGCSSFASQMSELFLVHEMNHLPGWVDFVRSFIIKLFHNFGGFVNPNVGYVCQVLKGDIEDFGAFVGGLAVVVP